MKKGKVGEVYCIGGLTTGLSNIEVVKKIVKYLGKSEDYIIFIKDRPGHDLRYDIDWQKIQHELGYLPLADFDTYLQNTINWYLDNRDWWKRVKSGDYQNILPETIRKMTIIGTGLSGLVGSRLVELLSSRFEFIT